MAEVLAANKEVLTLIGLVFTLLGLTLTLIIFVIQSLRASRIEQQENYMKLELASNELFRFEAANAAVLIAYEGPEAPPTLAANPASERLVRAFYFMTLNLFEISLRLRKDKTIPPEVFGSWVIWYYDTLTSWYFRSQWATLRWNYTLDLRLIFDGFVESFRPEESDDARCARFFKHVGTVLECPIVEKWLETPNAAALQAAAGADQTRLAQAPA